MQQEITIVIATHKKYKMPKEQMYIPLHVGAEGKNIDLGYTKDNIGDNISTLNSGFCELTGLYWIWKNINSQYKGLVHYRRHFSMNKKNKDNYQNILSYDEIRPYLGKIKMFLPTKRRYFIESLYSHYEHTHFAWQLDETRKIVLEKYPEYLDDYDKVMKHTSGYMFNMMIMHTELMDKYCTWLFEILFELKSRLNISDLSTFQGRLYGRISEIIFNVWLEHQISEKVLLKSEIMELKCINMEKINWRKKGEAFLKAKILKKKYEGSF